jgi:hypothetical protein
MTTMKRTGSMRFALVDVIIGSAITLGIFCATVVMFVGVLYGGLGLGTVLSVQSGTGDGSTTAYPGSPNDVAPGPLAWMTDILTVAALVVLIIVIVVVVAGLVGIMFAPIAGLISLALRRVPFWPIHLLAYFALGAAAAGCAVWAGVHPTGDPTGIFDHGTVALEILAGASAAGGWAIAWRIAVRRESNRKLAVVA